jgi:hypothetical protein
MGALSAQSIVFLLMEQVLSTGLILIIQYKDTKIKIIGDFYF